MTARFPGRCMKGTALGPIRKRARCSILNGLANSRYILIDVLTVSLQALHVDVVRLVRTSTESSLRPLLLVTDYQILSEITSVIVRVSALNLQYIFLQCFTG